MLLFFSAIIIFILFIQKKKMQCPGLLIGQYLPSYCSIVNDEENSIYYILLFMPKYLRYKKSNNFNFNIKFDFFIKGKIGTYNVETSNKIFNGFLSTLFSNYKLYVKIKKYNTTTD